MRAMELNDEVRGVSEMIRGFPRIIFNTVTFPFDQILQFLSSDSRIDYSLYFIFSGTINHYWWQWYLNSIWDFTGLIGQKF